MFMYTHRYKINRMIEIKMIDRKTKNVICMYTFVCMFDMYTYTKNKIK